MRLFVMDKSPDKPPAACVISSHCAAVRWSFHNSARRTTAPLASSATMPCICPDRPTPTISVFSRRLVTFCSVSAAACHQSSGACSFQPGLGVYSG